MNWMISANEKIYQHDKAFNEQYYIDWSSNASFEQGDIVYIYSTAPVSAITHICEVIKVNLKKEEETDDSQYWNTKVDVSDKKKHRIKPLKKLEVPITLDELKKHGLNAAPQGPVRIDNKPELLKFLKDFQVNYYTIAAGEGSTDRTLFYDNSIAALGWKTGDLSNCTSLEEAMKLSGENKLEAGYKMAWMLKHIKKVMFYI